MIYSVSGMSCAACSARVDRAVSKIEGVESCCVNLLLGTMVVNGDVSSDVVIKAVEDAGYHAKVQEEVPVLGRNEELLNKKEDTTRNRLLYSVVLLIVLMYFSMGVKMFDFPMMGVIKNNYVVLVGIELVLSSAILCINRKYFINGAKGAAVLSPNMDTLVALGSGVSFIYSNCLYVLLIKNYYAGDLVKAKMYYHGMYYESAAMILALITIGKLLEEKAKGRTTNSIRALMDLSPKSGTLLVDGEEKKVPIDDIRVGDVYVVHAGYEIPVDGIVVSGQGQVDESTLTGESRAVVKSEGDLVHTATMNLSGCITCKATKVGKDTSFAQIIQMVSNAAAGKAPIAKVADKVSAVFVPAVIGIAIITIAGWMIAGESIAYALVRGISVLVISCPCALGLATPVAIMVGNGVGAKCGVLYRSAEALEMAGRVNIIALDKTGTVTKGVAIPDERTADNIPDTSYDEIKEDSERAIRMLHEKGLKCVMITGDKKEYAKIIADKAGIKDVIANVLPGGKEEEVKRLKTQGVVAMVGDGVNDAVALTSADVGIAIGAGCDVAIDSADIVLMNSSLFGVVDAINLGKRTLKAVHQNLFWAFFYNIICIPLAAGCFSKMLGWDLNPMIGAFAMSLSSFCVVTNALRINDFKSVASGTIYNDAEDNIIKDTIEKAGGDLKMTKTLNVEGMMCNHCKATVEKALSAVEGVTETVVDLDAKTAVVTLSEDVSDEILKKAVEDHDFQVIGIK